MTIQRVNNDAVWQQIRTLFLGSAVLFLANIYFGFVNAIPDSIPRWQALVHTHSGTLGWVTLSVIGLAIWILLLEAFFPPFIANWSNRCTLTFRFRVELIISCYNFDLGRV